MTINQNFQLKSADIILNVESSHCYPSLEEFFNAVCLVLKDDGIFLYADFRYSGEAYQGVQDLIGKYFTIVKYEDIRRNVY